MLTAKPTIHDARTLYFLDKAVHGIAPPLFLDLAVRGQARTGNLREGLSLLRSRSAAGEGPAASLALGMTGRMPDREPMLLQPRLRPDAAARPATRSLVLLGRPPEPGVRTQIAQGLAPRLEHLDLADALGAPVRSAGDAPARLGPLAGRDRLLAATLAAAADRRDFDAVYATGEDLGLRLAALMRLTGWKGRLVTVVHSCISSVRKACFRALGPSSFHALICLCEAQRRVLVEELGFPREKVRLCVNWVDADFYAPDGRPAAAGDYVFSCGRENRDYGALFAAAARLPFPLKVAASGFRADADSLRASPGPGATLYRQRLSFPELKQAYAGSRFVVAPLRPVDYAAGVTGVLEAMAMGKAVITTASPGILDYVRDGVTGRVVPPGDPQALASAMAELWAAPDWCDEAGRRNRAWVRANASIDGYVRTVAELMSPGSAAAARSRLRGAAVGREDLGLTRA